MRSVSSIVLALSLLVTVLATAVRADQTDPRLDRLFERLAEASNTAQAQWLASRIWTIWYEYPNASVEALLRAGRAALDDGDLDGALIAFDDAVHKAPNFAEAWNARATAHYLMGNYARSLADVRRVLTLEPRHFGALAGRGLCYMKLGEPEKAIDAFEGSLAVHPHQPGVKANLELLRSRLGDRSL